MKKRLSFVQAIGWIVGSTIFISGSFYSGLKCYLEWQRKRQIDPAYRIVSIVQTGPQREALKTVYLAELMELSFDRPVNSPAFSVEKARKALLKSPVIKEAAVKVVGKDTVYVDYTVRQPIAWVYDYPNTAIDEEGYLFPVSPFFSPKKLPEIYFGMAPFGEAAEDSDMGIATWGAPLKGKQVELALKILKLLEDPRYASAFNVRRLDVSQAYADSYGLRQIVLMTEDEVLRKEARREVVFLFPRFLRLSTKNFPQELGNYLNLREQLLKEAEKNLKFPPLGQDVARMPEKVIDFRLPQLAFIQENK